MPNNLGNKQTMAKNIKYYMDKNGVSAADMCRILHVPQSTFSYWLNAKSYPRIDKIEQMANYFGIKKSDLVEEPSETAALAAQYAEISEILERMPPELRAHALALLKGLAQPAPGPDGRGGSE